MTNKESVSSKSFSEEINESFEKRRDYFIEMYKVSEVYMDKVLALSELYFMYQMDSCIQHELVDLIRKLAIEYSKVVK